MSLQHARHTFLLHYFQARTPLMSSQMLPFQGGLSQLPVNNENCILPTILTFFSPIASSPSNIIGSTFIYYNIVYYLSH